ncbi:hypothetical protein TNCV_1951491 [Trichonephila clavipes]|nr:hypothetical protein TNCV_1951491 [Trichonephila clavipes]
MVRDLLPLFPFFNLTCGFAPRRLFRVTPYRNGTIHSQTPMPYPGFEPRLYGTATSVTNQCPGWAATEFLNALKHIIHY